MYPVYVILGFWCFDAVASGDGFVAGVAVFGATTDCP